MMPEKCKIQHFWVKYMMYIRLGFILFSVENMCKDIRFEYVSLNYIQNYISRETERINLSFIVQKWYYIT